MSMTYTTIEAARGRDADWERRHGPSATATIIIESGRGAYDFSHDGVRIYTTKSGKIFVIADRWCGRGSIEGECYRSHIGEITEAQAKLLRSAARGERNGTAIEILGDMQIEWVRVAEANAALKAIAKAKGGAL